MANSVSKLKSLIVKTISEFWGFWKFAINANSFTLCCSEGASPAPDNVLNKCSGVQQAELGQNPALNSIQWDLSPLHCLWHCQRMNMCCYTLYQSAQSLGQNRRSTEAGTAWIFSVCSSLWAPLLLLPICSAPLVLPCSTEGRRVVGTCSLLYGAQSDRKGQEEILLYQEQESKGAETLSKNGRESGVWTSAVDSVWGLCPTSLHPAGFTRALEKLRRKVTWEDWDRGKGKIRWRFEVTIAWSIALRRGYQDASMSGFHGKSFMRKLHSI